MLGPSRFNRRLHRIPQLFQVLFEDLAEGAKAKNPNNVYIIDTFPVAVCDNIRISRSRPYEGEAWRGRIASKHRYFYGLKAHLMVTETGDIVEVFFTPGRFSDVRGLRCYRFDLPEGSTVYSFAFIPSRTSSQSQRRIVPSLPALTSVLPSGENENTVDEPVCPSSVLRTLPVVTSRN